MNQLKTYGGKVRTSTRYRPSYAVRSDMDDLFDRLKDQEPLNPCENAKSSELELDSKNTVIRTPRKVLNNIENLSEFTPSRNTGKREMPNNSNYTPLKGNLSHGYKKYSPRIGALESKKPRQSSSTDTTDDEKYVKRIVARTKIREVSFHLNLLPNKITKKAKMNLVKAFGPPRKGKGSKSKGKSVLGGRVEKRRNSKRKKSADADEDNISFSPGIASTPTKSSSDEFWSGKSRYEGKSNGKSSEDEENEIVMAEQRSRSLKDYTKTISSSVVPPVKISHPPSLQSNSSDEGQSAKEEIANKCGSEEGIHSVTFNENSLEEWENKTDSGKSFSRSVERPKIGVVKISRLEIKKLSEFWGSPKSIIESADDPESIVESSTCNLESSVESMGDPKLIMQSENNPGSVAEFSNDLGLESIMKSVYDPESVMESTNDPKSVVESMNDPELVVESVDIPESMVESENDLESMVESVNDLESMAESVNDSESATKSLKLSGISLNISRESVKNSMEFSIKSLEIAGLDSIEMSSKRLGSKLDWNQSFRLEGEILAMSRRRLNHRDENLIIPKDKYVKETKSCGSVEISGGEKSAVYIEMEMGYPDLNVEKIVYEEEDVLVEESPSFVGDQTIILFEQEDFKVKNDTKMEDAEISITTEEGPDKDDSKFLNGIDGLDGGTNSEAEESVAGGEEMNADEDSDVNKTGEDLIADKDMDTVQDSVFKVPSIPSIVVSKVDSRKHSDQYANITRRKRYAFLQRIKEDTVMEEEEEDAELSFEQYRLNANFKGAAMAEKTVLKDMTVTGKELKDVAVAEKGMESTAMPWRDGTMLEQPSRCARKSIYLPGGKKWRRSLMTLSQMRNNEHYSIMEETSLDVALNGVIKGRKWLEGRNDLLKRQETLEVQEEGDGDVTRNLEANFSMRVSIYEKLNTTATTVGKPRFSHTILPDGALSAEFPFLNCSTLDSPSKLGFGGRKSCFEDISFDLRWEARDIVLKYCQQAEPVPFERCFPPDGGKMCKKIGEGVYGEVFSMKRKSTMTVLKIIPVEGEQMVNDAKQKKFAEMLSEVIITMELSNLRRSSFNCTKGFAEIRKCWCIRGKYPDFLVKLWKEYDADRGSENDCPTMFGEDQLYVILELSHSGQDIESFEFNNAEQAYNVFLQVTHALAVAEAAFQFEHRDLHIGNILVEKCRNREAHYAVNGSKKRVKLVGIKATIIDFTLSRMSFKGATIFNDLSVDPELFTADASEELQFDIYRWMRDEVQNDWLKFAPKSNVFWLYYVLDKMRQGLKYKNTNTKVHREYKKKILDCLKWVQTADSCSHLLQMLESKN